MKLDRLHRPSSLVDTASAPTSPDTRPGTARGHGAGKPESVHKAMKYSRFVRLMKLLLPSVALVLVGLVLAWPQIRSQAERLAVSMTGLDPRQASPRTLVNPRFHGVDTKNQPYTLVAATAVEQAGNPDQVALQQPQGDIALETGQWLAVRGDAGLYSKVERTLDLDGNVVLYRDDGFEFHTRTAQVDLTTNNAWGADPVSGQGPDGEIVAGGFEIVDGGRVVVFTGQTHLVLTEGGDIAP